MQLTRVLIRLLFAMVLSLGSIGCCCGHHHWC
jgi:hypothetical protein